MSACTIVVSGANASLAAELSLPKIHLLTILLGFHTILIIPKYRRFPCHSIVSSKQKATSNKKMFPLPALKMFNSSRRKNENNDTGQGLPFSPIDEEQAASSYSTTSSLLAEHATEKLKLTNRRHGWQQWNLFRWLDFGTKDVVYMCFIAAIVILFASAEDRYISSRCGGLTYSSYLPRFFKWSIMLTCVQHHLSPRERGCGIGKSQVSRGAK